MYGFRCCDIDKLGTERRGTGGWGERIIRAGRGRRYGIRAGLLRDGGSFEIGYQGFLYRASKI